MGCFIASLKGEIHLDVKINQLRTLTDTIGVAQFIEECKNLQKKKKGSFCPSTITRVQTAMPNNLTGLLGPSAT